jgi:hypothetical protein
MNSRIALAFMTMPLSACATTSFAPPPVNTQSKVVEQTGIACATNAADASGAVFQENVAGATQLVSNFVLAYRCAERELANGRQAFQVPAFFAAVAGLAGPTFGLTNDAILASGIGAGVLNSGNSYYAPRNKAAVVGSALRAVLCIKTEAAGVGYFKHTKDPLAKQLDAQASSTVQDAEQLLEAEYNMLSTELSRGRNVQPLIEGNLTQRRMLTAQRVNMLMSQASASGTVSVSAQQQYFQMVSGALFSVESILAERLRDAGSVDTSDTFSRLKELVKQHAEAEAALKTKKETEGKDKGFVAMTEDIVMLENEVLHPRLQTCVLQARD